MKKTMLLVFFCTWVVFNGALTLEIALFGAAISLAMFLFCVFAMGYTWRKEWAILRAAPLLLLYAATVVKEVVLANWAVARIILSKDIRIQPQMTEFSPRYGKIFSHVLLADSITLTPGTITYRLEHGELGVHCLDGQFEKGLDESSFVKQIHAIEGRLER